MPFTFHTLDFECVSSKGKIAGLNNFNKQFNTVCNRSFGLWPHETHPITQPEVLKVITADSTSVHDLQINVPSPPKTK